jgi:hypothetical protein
MMLGKRPTQLAMLAAMVVAVSQSGRAADNSATAVATQTLGTTVVSQFENNTLDGPLALRPGFCYAWTSAWRFREALGWT